MEITKTSILGIIGLLAAIFAANSTWLNSYVTEAIISVLTIGVFNIFPSDNTGKPVINVISILSLVAAVAGYFLDHPHEVIVDGVTTLVYVVPIALLASLKNTFVAIIRYMQANGNA